MVDSEVFGLEGLPFQQIVESLHEIVWLSDALTGQVFYVTPNFETVWGLSREQLYRDRGLAVATVHPEDRERIGRSILTEQAAGTYDTEYRFLRPDGSVRWVHSRAVPLRDAQGVATRIVGITEDITDRKQAEAHLAESREQLGLFAEHAPASLAMFDLDMRYLVVSERWAQSNGLTAADLVGRNHYDLFPRTPEHVRRVHAEALAGVAYRCDEERFVRADGTEYWLHWEVHPWRHESDGDVAGVIVFTEDITERKRFLNLMLEIAHGVAAKTGAEFFNALVANLGRNTQADWVIVGELVDGGTRLRDVAQQAQGLPTTLLEYELAGRPCEAVLQRRQICLCADGLTEAFPTVRELAEHDMRAFAGAPLFADSGEPVGVLSVYSRQPFANPAEVRAVLQIFASRAQAELVRLQHERDLQELNASLEQRILERTALLEAANRDLEAFSYSVSHDLRAPLRAIEGYMAIAAEDGPLSKAQQLSFDKVRNNVQRMNELISELMGLAQLGNRAVRRTVIDLADVARDVVATLQERDPSRQVDVQIASAPAEGDPQLLRIVLENLIGNAWKFTAKTADARIRFGTETDEAGWTVYVLEDNGAGFDPDRAARLFQPFQRLHSRDEFEGTGVGLATVERIVRRHGGRIWADAKPGEGARFRFTLGAPV